MFQTVDQQILKYQVQRKKPEERSKCSYQDVCDPHFQIFQQGQEVPRMELELALCLTQAILNQMQILYNERRRA